MNEAPDNMEYAQWCLESWKHWCNKHDVEIFVLDTPLVDKELMKPTWQRWHVFEILDANNIEYEQVALVDMDTLIHPNAPNFFKLTDHRFTAVQDDLMVEWVHNSIKGYQDFWPDVRFDWTTYFNCGFIVLGKTHKAFCKVATDFYYANREELQRRQHQTLKKGSDQTPINYMIRKYFEKSPYINSIKYLDKRWNFTHLHQRGVLSQIFPEVGYLYHFNGFEKSQRNDLMRQCWDLLKQSCNI